MRSPQTTRRIAAVAPIVMSLISLALVVEGHFEFGSHPPADEGWQAHIFQFLMGAQIPLVVLYGVLSRFDFKKHLPVLAAQVLLWLLALGALRYFAL